MEVERAGQIPREIRHTLNRELLQVTALIGWSRAVRRCGLTTPTISDVRSGGYGRLEGPDSLVAVCPALDDALPGGEPLIDDQRRTAKRSTSVA